MKHATRSLALVIALVGCGGTGNESSASAPSDAGPADADAAPAYPQIVTVGKVDVYQAVQVTIAKDGAPVEARNAPLIAKREALFRVSAKVERGWQRKTLKGTLTITSASGSKVLQDSAQVGPLGSTDASLDSTFNFEVDKDVLTKDATYAIEIESNDGEPFARYPAEGAEPLSPVNSGTLKVKLVPVRYDADGTGRTPDLTEDAIAYYRDALYTMYPLQAVEVTTREPFAWDQPVEPGGSGWGDLLEAIVDLRNADKTPADVYYYGLFQPAPAYSIFCQRGCVAGLSGLLTDPRDSFARGSIGLGYPGQESAGTFAHELGHAHGRPHAPCGGPAGIDKKFPYPAGDVGVYGWNILDKDLYDTAYTDMMGYCWPTWVSDYTYVKLLERIQFVNGAKSMVGVDTTPRSYRFVQIDESGTAKWGRSTFAEFPPLSDPRTVTFEGPDGAAHTMTGHWYPYGDLGGGLLVVPESPITKAVPRRLKVDGLVGFDQFVPVAR